VTADLLPKTDYRWPFTSDHDCDRDRDDYRWL